MLFLVPCGTTGCAHNRERNMGRVAPTTSFSWLLALILAACSQANPSFDEVRDEGPRIAETVETHADDRHDLSEPAFGLPFAYTRPDEGNPLTTAELSSFGQELGQSLMNIQYFDYLLRSSHGVDASTGKPPYMLWWSDVEAIKSGNLVTFRHKLMEEHGGHNIITSTSAILATSLASAIGAADPSATRLATLLCRGISATMLGMVHDGEDELVHLMARNVVAFNHEYTTQDGHLKAVDYTGWYSPYERWNCQRFEFPDNPYWGPMWITNVRSKDDVGALLRVAGLMEWSIGQAEDKALVEACGETLGLLRSFAADIVTHDYYIRTKDSKGNPFIFSLSPKPEGMKQSDDLDNFSFFDPLFPGAECNARRTCDLLGLHEATLNDCEDGGPNLWERISLENNYPNVNFFRRYHLAHLYQALLHNDEESARALLDGLVRRFEEDIEYDTSNISVPGDRWHTDLAVALVRAAAQGYPLTSRAARLVHTYYRRGLEELSQWPDWNLWSTDLPDGTYDYKPPRSRVNDAGEKEYWPGIEDLGALLEYCHSPWRNPAERTPVSCSALLKALETSL